MLHIFQIFRRAFSYISPKKKRQVSLDSLSDAVTKKGSDKETSVGKSLISAALENHISGQSKAKHSPLEEKDERRDGRKASVVKAKSDYIPPSEREGESLDRIYAYLPAGIFIKREITPNELKMYVQSKLEVLCPGTNFETQIKEAVRLVGIRLSEQDPTKLDKRRISYKTYMAVIQNEFQDSTNEPGPSTSKQPGLEYKQLQATLFSRDEKVLREHRIKVDEKGNLVLGTDKLRFNHLANFIDLHLTRRYILPGAESDVDIISQEKLLGKIKLCAAVTTVRLVADGMTENNLADAHNYKLWMRSVWVTGSLVTYLIAMDFYHHKRFGKCALNLLRF